MRIVHSILDGEPEGKRLLGRPRHKWEDTIRMGVREIKWDGTDWMHLAQVRKQWLVFVNTVMSIRFP
jgi:hypothetical protein